MQLDNRVGTVGLAIAIDTPQESQKHTWMWVSPLHPRRGEW
jgi:hypothetical protein